VRFSPPVSREVTSADVRYAIERGFFSSVNNGYAGAYFGGLRGAKAGVGPGTAIPGIATPDDHTIVFELERGQASTRCAGVVLAGALAMPLSAPVPRELASRLDARRLSRYGAHQVATGPYMIERYEPGRRIRLVRNPNWNAALDSRPAYLDAIEIREGNDDAALLSRRVLQGESMINGDQPPPPAVLRSALRERKDQIQLAPSGGTRWIAMNTTIPPFDDVDVRRAVIAGFNREAMRLTYGGEASGDMPTHFLPPGIGGFDEAGGLNGQALDFMSHPGGDPQLAAEYFRRAGFPSGKYDGDRTLLMVGENAGPGADAALVAQHEFAKLGFHVRLRQVGTIAMFTKFCSVPKAAVAICPNVAWQKDFEDPETFLGPTFNGENILPTGSANWSQLDDHALNRRMQDASVLAEPGERARAWAAVDGEITRLAAAIPYLWPRWANLRSANVVGTIDKSNATWSLAYTRLK
jgi:peptide/nickel transport system substrate-binding protein